MKPENEFSSESLTCWCDLCSDCQAKAKESFYNRVKKSGTCKHTRPTKKIKSGASQRPLGSVPKRCPSCNGNVWVVRTEKSMICWKCGKTLKITEALRDSTCHRHGVILSVIE